MKKLYMLSIAALLMAGCAEDITNNPKVGNFLSFSVTEESGGRSTTRSGFSDAIDGQNGSGFVPQNSLFTKESNTGISPTMRIDSLESDYDEPLCMIVTTEPIGQRGSTRGTEVTTGGLNASGKSIQVSSSLYNGLANYSTTSGKFEPATATSWNGDASTSIAFSAWHPVTSELSTYGLSVAGTTFTYTLPATSANQTDLIGTSESHSYSENNNGNVPLTFKHLLAPVKFELAAGLKGTITSIKFSSIVKTGTHALGATDPTYGQAWTATSTGEYTATVSGTGTGSAVQVDGSEYFMMIPQTVVEGVVMTVTIKDNANTVNTLTYTVPSGGQVWKAGVVTTYTISTTAITSFTVTYPMWNDGGSGTYGPVSDYVANETFGLFAVDKAGKIVIANAPIKVSSVNTTTHEATCTLTSGDNATALANVIPSQNYTYYLMYPYVSTITTTYPAIALNATAPGGGSGTADTFFANVVSGWSVQDDQSTTGASSYVAESSNFRASDLQIAKLDENFAMAHRMGLICVSLSAHNVYDNITYDGNTYNNTTKKWEVSSYGTYNVWNGSTTFTSTDVPLVNGSKCYQVVKPNVTTPSYTTSTVTASKKYAWSQSCTAVSEANKYDSYTIDYDVDFIGATWIFNYSGIGQRWVAPKAGIYSFECWGASGGAATVTSGGTDVPGKGGYTYGRTTLAQSDLFFVFVGGVGVACASSPSTGGGGWNGGGWCSTSASGGYYNCGGGGATDIRLNGNTNATWKDAAHLRSRIMVAAGGGGLEHYSGYRTTGGYGGGLTGGQGYNNTPTNGYSNYTSYPNSGASQTATGKYYTADNQHGYGFFGYANETNTTGGWGGGGGSGYWGGVRGYGQGGSGGSSYISGHAGCIAIQSASSSSPSSVGSANSVERSKHYSGRYFSSTRMVDGEGKAWTTTRASSATGMPQTSGVGTENGHLGNGYARIIYIPE